MLPQKKLMPKHEAVVLAADFNMPLRDDNTRGIIGQAGGWRASAPPGWTVARSGNEMSCFDGFWWQTKNVALHWSMPPMSNLAGLMPKYDGEDSILTYDGAGDLLLNGKHLPNCKAEESLSDHLLTMGAVSLVKGPGLEPETRAVLWT